MKIKATLARWAGGLKQQTLVIYCVSRDRRTPWLVRLLAVLVAAYALSPVDLIPDFIPVVGYLDDLILLPLGIALIVRLTPATIIEDARSEAHRLASRPTSRGALIAIIAIWLLLAALLAHWLAGSIKT